MQGNIKINEVLKLKYKQLRLQGSLMKISWNWGNKLNFFKKIIDQIENNV
jgi:hypothetical protein